MRYFEAEVNKPASRLVLKLIRLIRWFILEFPVEYFAVISSVINYNFGFIYRSFNLDLNILIVMIKTVLKSFVITEIIPSENWFMYGNFLANFLYIRFLFFFC